MFHRESKNYILKDNYLNNMVIIEVDSKHRIYFQQIRNVLNSTLIIIITPFADSSVED